jgi:hypothetical protein
MPPLPGKPMLRSLPWSITEMVWLNGGKGWKISSGELPWM